MKSLRLPIAAGLTGLVALWLFFWPRDGAALNPNHDCSTCHNLHNSPGQTLTSDVVVEDLCLSCHGAAGSSSLKAEIHKNKPSSDYAAFTMTCIDCHDPHDHQPNWMGGTNLSQIGVLDPGTGLAKIQTPNSGLRDVVFESRGSDAGGATLYSFADNDEDGNGVYDGVCEVCHTLTIDHRNNSSGGHAHYTGQNCIACHPHDGYFIGSGGGCTSCHDGNPGGRRNVVSEFSLTSHHVAAGTVTDDDCGVCHYEAQGDHMDGNVDLLNPDTGARLTPFTSFSRNRSSDALESAVVDVQNNLCMTCHDSDGATATNFSGDALRPFSSGTRNVPNVFGQFDDTANAYHHAVRAAGTNTYCNTATMEPPWNQGDHDEISCFDCHATSGHGGANQRMLLDPIDLDTMEATTDKADLPSGMGLTVEAFCTRCHKASEYVVGDSNSKFEYHGANQNQHRAAGGNDLGCLGCHGGVVNLGGNVNGSARGNIHGGNHNWAADSWADGASSQFFMVGGWNSGWDFNTSAGKNGCGGGTCNHPGSTKRDTPGKEYTN